MKRLSRADFESMTVGELSKLLDRHGREVEIIGSECTVYANDDDGNGVSDEGDCGIEAMLNALTLAAEAGWFDPQPEAGR